MVFSAEEREAILAKIKDEVDAVLVAGEVPDPARWCALLPEAEEEITTLIELRTFSHEQDSAKAESDGTERVLAAIESEIQDALNRGKEPDFVVYEARYPHLASRIERLAATQDFVHDALNGDHAPASAADKQDEAQTALGRYRILGRIADHPVGTAYLAVSHDPPERIELLVLDPRISRKLGWEIVREADQSRNLQGDGLLPAREVGDVRGVRFVVSEHREGVSLSQVLMDLAFHGGERTLEHAMPPHGRPVGEENSAEDRAEANANASKAAAALGADPDHIRRSVALVRDIARIVAAAHLKGRLHRNLSPSALVVARDGSVWVRWFGLTRYLPPPRPVAVRSPLWRAPELLAGTEGAKIDWRADVWGVGALLFSLLRFEPPLLLHPGDVDRTRVLADGPGRLERQLAAVLPVVRPTLARSLAWDPAARHASCEALADELEVILRHLDSGSRGTPTRGDSTRKRRGWFRRRG